MSKGILGKSDQELFKYLLIFFFFFQKMLIYQKIIPNPAHSYKPLYYEKITKKTSLKIEITHPIFIKIIV